MPPDNRQDPGQGRRHSRHLPAFVLLVLAQGPRHGGAIQAALQERLPGYKADSAGIYRTLRALETQGALEAAWDTSQPGPARKTYSLTPLGWRQLEAWREDIAYRLEILGQFITACDQVLPRATPGPTPPDPA